MRFGELVAVMLRNDCPEHMHEHKNGSYSNCRVCRKQIHGDSVRAATKRKNTSKKYNNIHERWVKERQSEERKISLIQRIERLAQDAKIENFNISAELLNKTAENLRFSLRHDRNNGSDAEGPVHLRADLCDGCAKAAPGREAITGLRV